jgi:predicted nuclease with TOPRIM domain
LIKNNAQNLREIGVDEKIEEQKTEMKDIKNSDGEEEVAQLQIKNLKTEMNYIKTSNVELQNKIQKLKIKKDILIKHLETEMNDVKIEKQEEIKYLKTMHNEIISDVHYKYILGIIIGSSKFFFLIIVVGFLL